MGHEDQIVQSVFVFDKTLKATEGSHPKNKLIILPENRVHIFFFDYVLLNYIYIVKTRDNYVHFMRFNFNEPVHFKIALFDAIPKELLHVYQMHYELLIHGYINHLHTN